MNATKDKILSEVGNMINEEKITQLKKEIRFLQKKLGQAINNEQKHVNTDKALSISQELDELIIEYYSNSSSNKR